jgi:hypothetical protein
LAEKFSTCGEEKITKGIGHCKERPAPCVISNKKCATFSNSDMTSAGGGARQQVSSPPEKNVFKLDAILKSSAYFSVCFGFVRYLRHENGNLKKNALSKFESQCHVDFKHVFAQKSFEYFPRKTYSNLTQNLKFLNLRPVSVFPYM